MNAKRIAITGAIAALTLAVLNRIPAARKLING